MRHNVEVLLRERVENLGRCGDVVKVAPGYARNFLYPRRLAVPATEENRRMLARRTARVAAEEAVVIAELSQKAAGIAALTLTTIEKADEHGHLYGSVSPARAAELLSAAGYPCQEKDIRLARPIKTLGTHAIPVHLHADVQAEFTLEVLAPAASPPVQ
jgi:large subunit ribosomal protein L9